MLKWNRRILSTQRIDIVRYLVILTLLWTSWFLDLNTERLSLILRLILLVSREKINLWLSSCLNWLVFGNKLIRLRVRRKLSSRLSIMRIFVNMLWIVIRPILLMRLPRSFSWSKSFLLSKRWDSLSCFSSSRFRRLWKRLLVTHMFIVREWMKVKDSSKMPKFSLRIS